MPLTQVTAPALATEPLCQEGLLTTKLLPTTVMPPLPTLSLATVPVSVLIKVPSGECRYTAPMPEIGPSGSTTTKFPFGNTATDLPKETLPVGPCMSTCAA